MEHGLNLDQISWHAGLPPYQHKTILGDLKKMVFIVKLLSLQKQQMLKFLKRIVTFSFVFHCMLNVVDINNGLVGIVDEFYVQGLCRRGEWMKEAREKKNAMEGVNKGGQKEQELGEWRREKNGRVGKKYKGWKRETVEKGAKEGEGQEADRAEEIPGQKGESRTEEGE